MEMLKRRELLILELIIRGETKRLDTTFAACNNSNSFLSAYISYHIYEIDSLVVGPFDEVISAAELQ